MVYVYVVEECMRWEGGTVEAIFYNESRAIAFAKKELKVNEKEPFKVETYPKGLTDDDRRIVYIQPESRNHHYFYTVEEFHIIRDEEYIEGT
jgi:hypothetical protein